MDGVLADFEQGAVDYITDKILSGEAAELRTAIERDYITKDDLAKIPKNKEIRQYMYKHLGNNIKTAKLHNKNFLMILKLV